MYIFFITAGNNYICVGLKWRKFPPSFSNNAQLPIQTSPPCLGLHFLRGSHGHTMLVMLGAVERLALGEASVEDKLKEVVKTLRGEGHVAVMQW